MVGTKHCCWGECKSDSRYPEKLDESLKEMLRSGQKAFLPFAKPSMDLEKCQRWVDACCREGFTIHNVNKSVYICALHWPGKKGPTPEFPDPLKAKLTRREVKVIRAKRKARNTVVKNRKRLKIADDQTRVECKVAKTAVPFVSDKNKETLTEFTKYEVLSTKLKPKSNLPTPLPGTTRRPPAPHQSLSNDFPQRGRTQTIQNVANAVTVNAAANSDSIIASNNYLHAFPFTWKEKQAYSNVYQQYTLSTQLNPVPLANPSKVDFVSVQQCQATVSSKQPGLKVFPFMGKENKETQTELGDSGTSTKSTKTIQNETYIPRGIQIVSNTSLEVVSKSSSHMQHFTGLSSENFELFYDFVNGISPLHKITYWGLKGKGDPVKRQVSTWSYKEQLYMCLLGLKTAWSFKTMSILLSTPERKISEWLLRNIFVTYMQLISKVFRDKEHAIFPSKEVMSRCLPKVFKSMPRVLCSVGCAELKIDVQSSNEARPGSKGLRSRHDNTYKSLIALNPNGEVCFVSDLFEAEVPDVELYKDSGILKHFKPCDLLLVDRALTIQQVLNPLQAQFSGQTNFSVAEEVSTRRISKARRNVERFHQRLKEFQLIGNTIPVSFAPLAAQMAVVACGIINFQDLLSK